MDINHTSPDRAAILRSILAGNVGNDGTKQSARLLDAMERLGSITTVEAVRFLDIIDPRARKMSLVKAGHQVLMSWDRDQTESGKAHRIGRYSLVKGQQS